MKWTAETSITPPTAALTAPRSALEAPSQVVASQVAQLIDHRGCNGVADAVALHLARQQAVQGQERQVVRGICGALASGFGESAEAAPVVAQEVGQA